MTSFWELSSILPHSIVLSSSTTQLKFQTTILNDSTYHVIFLDSLSLPYLQSIILPSGNPSTNFLTSYYYDTYIFRCISTFYCFTSSEYRWFYLLNWFSYIPSLLHTSRLSLLQWFFTVSSLSHSLRLSSATTHIYSVKSLHNTHFLSL